MRVGMACAALAATIFLGCGKEEQNLKRQMVFFPNSKNFKQEWTIKMLPNGDTLMHGVAKEYFWNGSTAKSVVWKEGQRDGTAQAWYDNGRVKWQKSYDKGKRTNIWRLSYSDGRPWLVVIYVEGGLTGKAQAWENGVAEPKEAEFLKGSCVSGDCSILEPKLLPEAATPAEKTEAERVTATIQEFLD